ncbi:hypothetical protein IM792_09120 [Mucilaginibacter sp. JRF]|uniref:hypothetical protein n=1 Tax=Mucilaginibacter sp. JRF TaxID=2780088 RepID=UPI001883035A|nr:hypothetical protein [Mucilaginibacter sp. JRF]MBE9584604.1 hypothetical protein [Mucilaginibacter sp. JRF]
MQNLYWSVYKNLEKELIDIMFYIHIDDDQLNVYSPKIANLIVRCVVEIESITKDLYKRHSGNQLGHKRYDDIGISYLEDIFALSLKVIELSSIYCFQSQKRYFPFEKSETRTGKKDLTFSWNNAYQNIKHDRANSLKFGSLKYLFDAMSALYLLNIYLRDEKFNLGKYPNYNYSNFPNDMGSEIFSVKLYLGSSGIPIDGKFGKSSDFGEFVYRVSNVDDEFLKEYIKTVDDINNHDRVKTIEHFLGLGQANPALFKGLNQEQIANLMFEEKRKNNFFIDKDLMLKMDYASKQVNNEAIIITVANS